MGYIIYDYLIKEIIFNIDLFLKLFIFDFLKCKL